MTRLLTVPSDEARAHFIDLTPIERVTPHPLGNLHRRLSVHHEWTCFNGCRFGSPDCRPGSGGFHGQHVRDIEWEVWVEGVGGVSKAMHTPIHHPDGSYPPTWHPLGALILHYSTPPEYLADDGPTRNCLYTGGDCWSDSTMLQSETAYERFLDGGTEGVWAWLGEAWLPEVLGATR